MLTVMAREFVEKRGIAEPAEAIWRLRPMSPMTALETSAEPAIVPEIYDV